MSEKGGKRFSAPAKATKATSVTPLASSIGKDDGSVKSKKRGRKVKINPEVKFDYKANSSPLSGGKGETLFSKGISGKGVTGGKTANDTKTPAAKESIPLELRVEPELPNNAKCLMDCEAAQILEGIQEQMVVLSEDPAIKIPVSFDHGLQYARNGNHYANPSSVRRVLETLTKHGVTEGEMCVIANVCPETADEVFALVPSLKSKRSQLSEPVNHVLGELAMLKRVT